MMTTETKVEGWGRYSIAWVQSDDIQPALNLLRSGRADGLGVSPYKGYSIEDISFLGDIPNLNGIVLPYAKNYDLKTIENISSLRFLTISGSQQQINFSALSELEDLRIEWNSKVVLPDPSAKLISLYIRGYKPKLKNLTNFPKYENLTELEINQGNLVSLEGIERFPKLDLVSLFHLRQLQSIDALFTTKLESLHIEGCKKIPHFAKLNNCCKLKSLRLIDCGTLSSINFIKMFENLEEFRFVNTTVEDGDMTPLLELKSVGFLKKSNYSHTPEEIKKAIGGTMQ